MASTGRRKRPPSTPHRPRPYAVGGSSPKPYPCKRHPRPYAAGGSSPKTPTRVSPAPLSRVGVLGEAAWKKARGTAGDHKGPPRRSPPPSPLRTDEHVFKKPTRVSIRSRPYAAFIPRSTSVLKERLLWGSAAAACGEPAEETDEEVDHAENDEAGEDDIIAGTAAVRLGLGIRVGYRGDDDAYDSHERAAYH